jgi:hypothetical protein
MTDEKDAGARHAAGRTRLVDWIAPMWALSVCVYLVVAPVYRTVSDSAPPGSDAVDGRTGVPTDVEPALTRRGWAVSLMSLIPLVLSTFPLLCRPGSRRRVASLVAAAILSAFCVAALPSIGLYYMPSCVALVVQGRVR